MHYATIDANGYLTGLYDDEINTAIPQGAIAITITQWLSWISDQTQIWSSGQLVKATPSLAQLASALKSDAAQVCTAIVGMIYPDDSHQAALQNAALVVRTNGGAAPPSADPAYADFNALASSYGMMPANFAAMVATMTTISIRLGGVHLALINAATAATTAAALNTALNNFETAVTGIVTSINAVVPVAIPAPAPISIPGVNA